MKQSIVMVEIVNSFLKTIDNMNLITRNPKIYKAKKNETANNIP